MSAIATETRLAQLQADVDACGPDAQKLFKKLLREGKTAEAAAMYACQQAPGTRFTDRAFNQGQRRKMESMSPLVSKMLHDTARKAGIDTRGKYYMSGLGRATDKAAWVTSAEDVLTVAKQRNLDIDGVIRHKGVATETKPRDSVPVAPDILNELEAKAVAADPALAAKLKEKPKARRELREALVEKHGPKKHVRKTKRLLA